MFIAPKICRPNSSSGASSFLAARVVQPLDGEFTALTVDQPEEPSGGQGFGSVLSGRLARSGLADRGRLGPS
jgi:hypothetical protein